MYGVSGAVMLLFAAWLLFLSPRQRATRAFVLLLASMGVAFLAGTLEASFGWLATHHDVIAPTVVSGIGLSTVYFLCVYPRPRGWIGRARWGGWSVFGAWLALAILFALRPDLYRDGPLVFIENAWSVSAGFLFVLLAIDVARAPPEPVRRALVLVLAGFLGSAFVFQGMLVLNDLGARLQPGSLHPTYGRAMYVIEELVLLFAVAAVLVIAAGARRSRDATRRREAAALGALALVALSLAAVVTFAFPPPAPARGDVLSVQQEALDAFTLGVLMPLFIGYALLKHRLFDIDVKVRWTISRGTVAVIFVLVFFVAAQLAQNFLEDSMGWALGGVTAGLLLFAIAPIQRVAERVARTAIPVQEGSRADDDAQRRARVYKLALAMALSDRAVSRDEERHLAALADELGIGSAQALALREEAEREMGLAA